MDSLDRTLHIGELRDGDRSRWDAFVDSLPDATLFHRSAWKTIIQDSLDHPCHFL